MYTENISIPGNATEYDRSLFLKLMGFDPAVESVIEKLKPHTLANYAYELATSFSAFYVHTPKLIEESDTDLRSFRLGLVEKTAEALKKAFDILAIRMPSEM